MKVRPATDDDVAAFYGAPPAVPVRMLVMEQDGVPMAIGGLAWSDGEVLAASWISPRASRRQFVRASRRVLEMFNHSGEPRIIAHPDIDEPSARRFLAHIGFTTEDGQTYEFRPHLPGRP